MLLDCGEAIFLILRHSRRNSECAGKLVMLDLMLLGGTAMKAAASAGAGKLAGMLVEKGKAKIFPVGNF